MRGASRRRVRFVVVACLWTSMLGLAEQSFADGPNASGGPQRVTSIEGVTEYRLENGLRVLLYPEPSKPLITVNITYLVGSRQENYGETGMAHLLEHLMFKGTPKHPKIPDEISLHGAQVNGSTTVDRTNYYEICSATDENLEWALDLEADRMVNSFIAKKDLDSEMTVVRNELERGENSPGRILQERVLAAAYLWHNYGHPTIGARSDLENVPIDRLQAFYRTYYQPDNAVLVVAGKLDEAKTLSLIQARFGSTPKPLRPLPAFYTVEPEQDGEREVVLRRVGEAQIVTLAYHIPSASHLDTITLDLLSSVLNEVPEGRLYKRLVEAKLATEASGSVMGSHDPGLLSFTATLPKDSDLKIVKDELIKVAEGVASQPISEEELNRARNESLNTVERALTSADAVGLYLTESIALGDWRLLFWGRDQLKKTTTADLARVAAKYLIPSNRTAGLFVPEDKPTRVVVPANPDLAAMLNGYTGQSSVSAGEEIEATPAAIEARTRRTSIESLKVALLEKRTRGNLVSAVMDFHFGNALALRGHTTAGSLAAALLMSGCRSYNMTQLQDEITRLKAELNVNGDESHVSIQLTVPRENLIAAIRLAADVIQHPTFPEDQFEQLKKNLLLAVKGSSLQPNAVASLAIRRYLSPYKFGDVRYVPTTEETLAELRATTLNDVKRFHENLYGIGSGEAAFVGPFDEAELLGEIRAAFGQWKSRVPYERISWDYKEINGKTESFSTPDKANAVVVAAATLNLSELDTEYPAIALGNYIFGGGFLNSRLANRIRQREGLSYNVESQLSVNALDRNGSFSLSAICAPQNVTKVDRAYREEIASALENGFTSDEVAAAKTGMLQARQMRFADDDNIAATLASHLYIDRDLHWDERFDEAIKALTPDLIRDGMRHHISASKFFTVSAGDFSKARN